jgi:hypothetical protein
MARYHNEQQRADVVALYESARAVFARQAEQ